MESFRVAPIDATRVLGTIPFAHDRARVGEALAEVENARRTLKPRLFPLAAANAVVGVALLVFTWGLLSRRERARVMTAQLLGAQMALELIEYVVTPSLRDRVLTLASAFLDAQLHAAPEGVGPGTAEALRAVVERMPAIVLGAALIGRALTIAPLLRQETRAYCLADGESPAPDDSDGES